MGCETLISVIIPAFNADRTIVGCLDSVFADPTADVECIVIDDGSTDGTVNVVRDYSVAHPNLRIRLISQINRGVSVARNHGIETAEGTWVTFVDADDMMREGWLKTTRDAVSSDDEDDVIIFTRSAPAGRIDPAECLRGCLSARPRSIDVSRTALCGPYSKAYRRSSLLAGGFRFPAGIRIGEDMLFNAGIYATNPRIAGCPHPVYLYRKQTGSATNQHDSRYVRNELDYHRELLRILDESSLLRGEAHDIITENCLGGILGILLRTPDAFAAVHELMKSDFAADYRTAIRRAGEFADCFTHHQRLELHLAASGHIRAASTLAAGVHHAKRLRYAISGGTVIEEI